MADLKVKFTSDTRNFQQGVSQVHKSIQGVKNSVNTLNTAIAAIGIGKLASAFGAFGADMIKSSSDAASSFETLSIQLEVLTGSASKAADLVKQIKDYGATTPLEQGDLQQSVKTLLQFNVASEDVMGILMMLGDVSMGNGEKLQSLSRVFGQVSSAGKLTMEDVNQLIDAGFNPLINIAAKTGDSMSELRDKVSKGEVSASMLTDSFKMATGEGGKFNNMLTRISGTTEGKLSNLSDTITALKASFGAKFNEGLKPFLDSLVSNLPKLEGTAATLGSKVGTLLAALSDKVPQIIDDISSSLEGQDGIMGAIKRGLENILQDERIKNAARELVQYAIQGFMGQEWKDKVKKGMIAASGLGLAATVIDKTTGSDLASSPNSIGYSAVNGFLSLGRSLGASLDKYLTTSTRASQAARESSKGTSGADLWKTINSNPQKASSVNDIMESFYSGWDETSNAVKRAMLPNMGEAATYDQITSGKGIRRKAVENPSIMSMQAYKPFITSLASVGGGMFYTGKDSMGSLQRATNQYLAKIERNTKNIKVAASWT